MTEEIALPGGGLTRPERRQIAPGPADSLPCAEFARRLGRPTSTVAREVMRNGGPTTYRAGLAHRATERRADRRRPASSRGPESLPQPHGRDAEALAEYEERFTVVLMDSGLTRMAARVLICSVHHRRGQPHRVPTRPASPGHPASKAIAYLESRSLVRRQRDERRRDPYVVDDELFHQATIAGARSNDQLVETALRGVHVLGPHTPAAIRLENIARFLEFIGESITRAAEQAREVLHTKAATTSNDTARPGSDPG